MNWMRKNSLWPMPMGLGLLRHGADGDRRRPFRHLSLRRASSPLNDKDLDMKKNFTFLARAVPVRDFRWTMFALVIALFPVTPACADKIGINFVGGSQPRGTPAPIRPDELAGPFLQKFWNNAYERSGTLSPLGDNENGSSASYTGFSVNWTAFQTNTKPIAPYLGPGYGIEGPPDYRLGLGYLDATANQPATVTFSNIPAQFTGAGRSYSLVVFFSLDNIDYENRIGFDKVNIFTLKGTKAGEKNDLWFGPLW
jgi:hypothetical protein